jgi:hypothetical protein
MRHLRYLVNDNSNNNSGNGIYYVLLPELGTSATSSGNSLFAIRYLANREKISEIEDLKSSGIAVAYCKVSLPLLRYSSELRKK